MTNAVQDHLGHGAHAVTAFATGFVIGGLGEAIEIARGFQRAGEAEGLGGDGRRQIGLAQAFDALRAEAAQLFEAGGQEFGLTVALARARRQYRVVP